MSHGYLPVRSGSDGSSTDASGSASSSLKRSRSHRSFFADDSTFGCVVNIGAATLGVGSLAFPYAISQVGIIPSILLILLAAWSSRYSIRILLELVSRTDADSFEELGEQAYGWWGKLFTQITMLVFCW